MKLFRAYFVVLLVGVSNSDAAIEHKNSSNIDIFHRYSSKVIIGFPYIPLQVENTAKDLDYGNIPSLRYYVNRKEGDKNVYFRMLRFLALCVLMMIVYAQQYQLINLGCGFTCTKKAQFMTIMDGTLTSASCSASGADPRYRCKGCCQSRALISGLTTAYATGFPSNNGIDCICCFYNKCR